MWRLMLAALVLATVAAIAWIGMRAWHFWQGHFMQVRHWSEVARTAPEGKAAQRLFDQAVEAGAIVWNTRLAILELRPDVPMPSRLYNELFKVGEAGSIIAREIVRSQELNQRVSLRVRFTDCDFPCLRSPTWRIQALPASHSAQGLALAASQATLASQQAPSPRLHYALSRHVPAGFGRWRSWRVHGEVAISANATDFDMVDVVGSLVWISQGWRIQKRWCRNRNGILNSRCRPTQNPAAFRLVKTNRTTTSIHLRVRAAPVLNNSLGRGTYHLSERIRLVCKRGGKCTPHWLAGGVRRYVPSRAAKSVAQSTTAGSPPAYLRVLGPWAVFENGEVHASDLAMRLGAIPIVGHDVHHSGSLLSALSQAAILPNTRTTLDERIQRIAWQVLQEALQRKGAFAGSSYDFASDVPRVSLTIMDLRRGQEGNIRAVVGSPTLPAGLSPWDRTALRFDPAPPIPPHAAAWSGRGWHHIPGSTWKVLTSLVLIHAISATDADLPPNVRKDLEIAMMGGSPSQLERIFGRGVLRARHGICVAPQLGQPIVPAQNGQAARRPRCPAGYGAPIRDAGRGGPLRNIKVNAQIRFGVVDALAMSSNIWFVAALLRAESAAAGKLGSLMLHMSERLGFLQPQALDGGHDLKLQKRDPAGLELTRDDADASVLARSAFGQRLQAGPLILAQLAAAVALNRKIEPALLEPVVYHIPKPLFSSPQAVRLLQQVRKGMRAVIARRKAPWRGTAAAIFRRRAPALRQRVAGKTGTAQRDTGRDRISSFLGWLDDRQGNPAFALGCSAALRGQRGRGGSLRVFPLCAHIAAEVFRRLDKEVLAQ